MQVHGYTHAGGITVTIDGLTMTVPDDPANRHRQAIAEWEAEGNTIAPYTPPVPPIGALTRRQARLGLLSIGITPADVEAHIAAITDPIERAAALIEWQDAGSYDRNHPLVLDLAEAFALPQSQVDALWIWAADQF